MKVAIIGGGYAGYNLAHLLDPHVNVKLIEAREAFVHNVAAIRAIVEPGLLESIVIPYDKLLKRGRVIRGRAVSIDPSCVNLADGSAIEADAIVIATGSHYAAPFKPQGDNTAELTQTLSDVARQVAEAAQIIIVGAGAVGVELAGEIKAKHPDKPVVLVSDQPRLFPMYPVSLHAKLLKRLSAINVVLHLGQKASGLIRTDMPHAGEITLADGTRLGGLIIPAVGARIADSPAHELPNVDRKPNGQIGVDRWLRPSSLRNVFAIGDLAATGEGMTVVATARQTPWLAKTIRKLADGKRVESLSAYAPWKTAPILLPLGPEKGVSVLPIGAGLVVGDGLTSAIKGKDLFVPRYRKEFGIS
jgi:apoptosis-inducing factor 2